MAGACLGTMSTSDGQSNSDEATQAAARSRLDSLAQAHPTVPLHTLHTPAPYLLPPTTRLDGLAQAHLVAQDAARALAVQLPQPLDGGALRVGLGWGGGGDWVVIGVGGVGRFYRWTRLRRSGSGEANG